MYSSRRKIRKVREQERIVPQYIGADGRMKVQLVDKYGVSKEHDVANIVARTFIPSEGVPECALPMFKDGNPANCAANNLYWECTK